MGIKKIVMSETFIKDIVNVRDDHITRIARQGHYRIYKNDIGDVVVEFFKKQTIKPL